MISTLNKLVLLVIACVAGSAALAFNLDGVRSGMTVEELKAYAAGRGLDFRSQPSGDQHIIGNFQKYEVAGTFLSCKGRVVLYSRSVEPEVAYTNILIDMLKANGQPKITADRLQVLDRPGVTNASIAMSWYVGEDRITLAMSPELRDGAGALIFNRGASLEYTVRNTCYPNF